MKIRSAEFVKSGTRPEHYPEELPELAFCGRSNVGKSSLMNSLVNRKSLVKVSGKPGHTRLLNWFKINDEILLCDLPGYGFARVPPSEREVWARMINTYLSTRESLLGLVILVDVRRGFQDDDLRLMEACSAFQLQPILVVTKIDKLKRNELVTQKRKIAQQTKLDADRDVIWYSAVTHAGRDQLWRRIMGLIPRMDQVEQAEQDVREQAALDAIEDAREQAEQDAADAADANVDAAAGATHAGSTVGEGGEEA